jgi:hypothetical protein
MAKSRYQTCGQWFEDSELDDHLNIHLDFDPLAEPPPEPKQVKCPDCSLVMDAYYGVPFHISRTDPATILFVRTLIGIPRGRDLF